MSKARIPMQVSPEFVDMLKGIQTDIMLSIGKNISLRDLTEDITRTTNIENIKAKLIERRKNAFDIPIKFHKR